MDFPLTIEDQAAFNKLIAAETRDLRKQVGTLTQERDDATKACDESIARAEAAEAKVGEFETAQQIASWRTEVATAAKVPADALRGSTKEELEAHAEILKTLIAPSGVVPSPGKQPDGTPQTDEATLVRELFGNNE